MICTEYDQFLKEKDKTVWMVKIYDYAQMDEYVVYQDDDRPGCKEPKAWIRLKNWLTEDMVITGFSVGFRDHIEEIPIKDAKGIYFSFGAVGDMFNPSTSNFYVLGVVEGDKVHKYWYRVPEVILYEETWDPLPEADDPRLIIA